VTVGRDEARRGFVCRRAPFGIRYEHSRRGPGSAASGLADGLVIALVTGSADALSIAALALSGAALLAAFGWPRATALVALALGMLQYGPTKTIHLVPEAFTVVDDFLLAALALRWIAGVAARRVDPPVWVVAWLLIWMGFGALNAVFRGIGVATTLVSYRWMFLPLVLYLVCAHHSRQDRFARDVIRLVVVIGLFQAAVAVVQAGMARSIGDTSVGLLGYGGAIGLGFLSLLAAVLVAASDKPESKSVWLVILGLLGPIAAQARMAIFTSPFALMLVYRGRLLKGPRVVLATVLIVVACATVLVVATDRADLVVSSRNLSPQYLIAAQLQTPDRGGGRLVPLLRLPSLFGTSPLGWLAGLGPGQYGSAFRQIPFMIHYHYQVGNSEWTVICGEYGLIGLLCLTAILSRPLMISFRLRKRWDDPDWTRQMVRAATSIVFVAICGMTVLKLLEYQPFSYPLWALLGLLEGAFAGSMVTTSTIAHDRTSAGDPG